MNKSICGANCADCGFGKGNNCKGCAESKGCPFGKECFIYKYIKLGGIEKYNELYGPLDATANTASENQGQTDSSEAFASESDTTADTGVSTSTNSYAEEL